MCSSCDKTFTRENNLSKHRTKCYQFRLNEIIKRKNESIDQTDIIKSENAIKSEGIKEGNIHEDKKFQCTSCEKTYAANKGLQRHEKCA